MKSIISILENDSSLNGLIGSNKVFSGYAPQKATEPYVLVVYSVEDPHTSGTGQNLDELTVRVFSASKWEYTNGLNIGATEISTAVRTALQGYKGTSEGQEIDINFESSNTQRITNPNNPSVEIEQIYQVFMIVNYTPQTPTTWILEAGIWNDGGVWDDTKNWID